MRGQVVKARSAVGALGGASAVLKRGGASAVLSDYFLEYFPEYFLGDFLEDLPLRFGVCGRRLYPNSFLFGARSIPRALAGGLGSPSVRGLVGGHLVGELAG